MGILVTLERVIFYIGYYPVYPRTYVCAYTRIGSLYPYRPPISPTPQGQNAYIRIYRKIGVKMGPKNKQKSSVVIGVDPGLSGAFVLTDGVGVLVTFPMPLNKEKMVDTWKVEEILIALQIRPQPIPVFMEKPVSFGMGTKSAFNYGRGYQALLEALRNYHLTLVEPAKWAKQMHEGISADLKPKAKSLIAVKKLFPQLVGKLPVKPRGGLYDGPVDALLIAGYGLRHLEDF